MPDTTKNEISAHSTTVAEANLERGNVLAILSGQETDFPTGYKIPSAGSGSGIPSGVTVKKVEP